MDEHCNLENNIASLELIPIAEDMDQSCSKESELVVGRRWLAGRVRTSGPYSMENCNTENNEAELENYVEECIYLNPIEEMSCTIVSELVI